MGEGLGFEMGGLMALWGNVEAARLKEPHGAGGLVHGWVLNES